MIRWLCDELAWQTCTAVPRILLLFYVSSQVGLQGIFSQKQFESEKQPCSHFVETHTFPSYWNSSLSAFRKDFIKVIYIAKLFDFFS